MIIKGDCLEVLKTLSDNSVDSIVTDPPYGISFMGKKYLHTLWEYDTMGLWKHFGIRLKKPELAGYGLAQITGRVMERYALKVKSIILTAFLTSGKRVKYVGVFKLTICVEIVLVATQNIWKQSLQKLI